MKKIICSVLFLVISACQSPQLSDSNIIVENSQNVQNTKISSKPTVLKSETNSLFPSTPGYTWNYDVVFHPADDPYVDYKGTYTLEVESSKKSSNNTVINLRGIDSLYSKYNFPVLTISKDNVSVKGITYLGFGAVPAEDLTIDFLHLPFKAGEKWDDELWTGQTMKSEKVTIPSGTYDAWRINVIGTYQQTYTAVGNYWISPGIGIIKSELSVPGWSVESFLTSSAIKAKK